MALSEEIGKEAVRVLGNDPGARTASLLYEGGEGARLPFGRIEGGWRGEEAGSEGKVDRLLFWGTRGGWVGEDGCLEGRVLGFSPGKLGEDGVGKKAVSRGRGVASLRSSSGRMGRGRWRPWGKGAWCLGERG